MPAPAQTLDVNQVLSGYQGELFDENGNLIAQVNTFKATIMVNNNDYQAAGSLIEAAILKSYRVTLTFTETVIQDTQFLGPVVSDIIAAIQPSFNFQGRLFRQDGSESEYLFNDCVPDGSIDILSVAPGQVIDRAWSWRCNKPPALTKLLGA